MGKSLTQKLGYALTLNQAFYHRLSHQSAGRRFALTLVFIAAISNSLGSLLILMIHRASFLALGLGLVIHASLVVAGYYFWTLTIWQLGRWFHLNPPAYGTLLNLVGFAYAPQIFNFFTLIPLLGPPIHLGLALWSLLAVMIAVHHRLKLPLFWSSCLCLPGWFMINLGLNSLQVIEQRILP